MKLSAKIPEKIINDIKDINVRREKNKDSDDMDILMKTIKAVHSSAVNPTAMTVAELMKQRNEVEIFSRLITPVAGVQIESFEVDGMNCEYAKPSYPHRSDRIIMYCHGGGYTSGGIRYARILAAKLALHTGLEVVSFEYGLAPEHQFPEPINDGMKVWDYLMHKGYGASNVIIAGDSAGGNMALEICLNLKKHNRFMPLALCLMSPWTDMSAVNNSYSTYKEKDPLLTYEYVVSVRTAYAGNDADYTNPDLSPIYADLSGLPKTLIQVGSNEILRDDSEKLAKKLVKSGVTAKLEVYQGGWHVFQQMPIPKAGNALDSIGAFVHTL